MVKKPRCFEVYLTTPTPGADAKAGRKEHRCLVLSADADNADPKVDTVTVAPMAGEGVARPSRVKVRVNGKDELVFLDHKRDIAKTCLIKRLGKISQNESWQVFNTLAQMLLRLPG